MAGEIIIYDPDSTCAYYRVKYGDGVTNIINLPFASEQADWNQLDENNISYIKNKPVFGALALKDTVDQADLSAELQTILETYILNIDYNAFLAFDTSEVIIGTTSTTSVLGQAILGQMVLA